MLIVCVFTLVLFTIVGSLMTNYAWREAQLEELRSAVRAAVSASGPLLGDVGGAMDAQVAADIRERVAEFVTSLLSGVSVSADDVAVSHDQSTGVTTITVSGERIFHGIWLLGDVTSEFEEVVRVNYQRDRYEVAAVLDVSGSMGCGFGTGCPQTGVSRLDALKQAMAGVVDAMETKARTRRGTLLVSVVPFGGAVNVADTAGTGHTEDKERYVRMLVGPHDSRSDMLRTARDARDAGVGGHWVDTFHHYGTSAKPGLLARQYLPDQLLDDRDWNLRQTSIRLDVSGQVPGLGTWIVDGKDFWNGCVMARWGAYWNAAARPSGWQATATSNWPARQKVEGWSPRGSDLPSTTPLHLSDAPPDNSQPHTLFTAYSWPDARISGGTDARLQTAMARLLGATNTRSPNTVRELANLLRQPNRGDWLDVLAALRADNNWSFADGGGDALCPDRPIVPLTEDIAGLRTAIARLSTTGEGPGEANGMTLLPVGVAWGLRTLSPLWRDVWQVSDGRGAERPGVPCALQDTQDCDNSLKKFIVIVSDGANNLGPIQQGALRFPWFTGPGTNPYFLSQSVACDPRITGFADYMRAAAETVSGNFNSRFGDSVDGGGTFSAQGRQRLVDALLRYGDSLPDTGVRRANLNTRLAAANLTPWAVFRGLDAGTADFLTDTDNEFGFDGRPTLTGRHLCHLTGQFGAYGRALDSVYVGDDENGPIEPMRGVAPFAGDLRFTSPLDNWFVESCRIAWRRGVQIFAIYIGSRETSASRVLERCVDSAGGTGGERDVFMTATANDLQAAFNEIFLIRAKLSFLD